MMVARKKILIVDDNAITLKVARNILMVEYDAFTVPSAEMMFRFLKNTIPDLILLDVLMPGMTGYEALRILQADPRTRRIPVVFLSSQSDEKDEIEGFSLGAVDYITKPFSPPRLIKRIERHLLVETQRAELEYINNNLQSLVNMKTRAVTELQTAILTTVSELVECRDDVTGEHVFRTSRTLRLLVTELMNLNVYTDELLTWDIDLMLQSSQLHDVGKISIHDHILLKPGKLTPAEFEEMKKHSIFGEEIIDRIQKSTSENAFLKHAKIMAGSHHEKWDGSGYPRGLAGADIPLEGRLMAVADVYDALISKRPYKPAFSHEQAIEILLQGCGSHFDPALEPVIRVACTRFAS
ncbi:MAG: response regulator [Clostridiales bacterium]|jgi:putative two-component system response regulator|nr:response regulator [Clostridiales bacterium]